MVEKRSARSVLFYMLIIFYCLFNIFSFLWIISASLKGKTEFFSSSPWSLPKLPHWANYVDAWKIGHLGSFLLNSVYVTLVSTLGCLLVSSLAAYILGRIKFRASGFMTIFFLLGLLLPQFMIVIPLYSILLKLSLLNTLHGLILVYITMQIPFNVYVLSSFYKNLPYELEEAAGIDGATPLSTYIRIMMPLTLPVVTACGIINVLAFWNEFLFALVFLGDKKLLTLPIGLFYLAQNAEYAANWGALFAGMIICSIPVLLLFGLFQKQFTSGISQGAIKI